MKTNNDIKLSFILPIYNVEDYLQECVDSILCQINEECAIILVDGGSTDSSGVIFNEDKYKKLVEIRNKAKRFDEHTVFVPSYRR